jgi:hypothetical protein
MIPSPMSEPNHRLTSDRAVVARARATMIPARASTRPVAWWWALTVSIRALMTSGGMAPTPAPATMTSR